MYLSIPLQMWVNAYESFIAASPSVRPWATLLRPLVAPYGGNRHVLFIECVLTCSFLDGTLKVVYFPGTEPVCNEESHRVLSLNETQDCHNTEARMPWNLNDATNGPSRGGAAFKYLARIFNPNTRPNYTNSMAAEQAGPQCLPRALQQYRRRFTTQSKLYYN